MKRCFTALALAALLLGPTLASAEGLLRDRLIHRRLANGVTVLIVPRPGSSPHIGCAVYVDAGSAEENAGDTGLAHVLEHMAFKGTPYIGTTDWKSESALLVKVEEAGTSLAAARRRQDTTASEELLKQLRELQRQATKYIVRNEYDLLITREGGQDVNASTSVDFTNYFMSIPSNKLEMWALMESQRLLYPSWRDFYQERDVVMEERRMRVDDTPFGRLYEEFLAAAYRAHPYKNPTIGWMSDLQNLNVERTVKFYRERYVPGNMTVVLVGDTDEKRAMPLMEKYFGSMPARPTPPLATTVEPPQQGERRVQVVFDAEPQILMGWHKPSFPHKDLAVFEVIQYVLTSSGRSSRLYQRLVTRDGLVGSVESFTAPGDKYPNMVGILAAPVAPHTTAEVEKAIGQEIERLKSEPVPPKELERVRNQIQAAFLRKTETNLGLAMELGYYYVCSKDPNVLDNVRDTMLNVSPEDIQRVMKEYFTKDNLTVAELVKSTAAPAAAPAVSAPTKPATSAPPAAASSSKKKGAR